MSKGKVMDKTAIAEIRINRAINIELNWLIGMTTNDEIADFIRNMRDRLIAQVSEILHPANKTE